MEPENQVEVAGGDARHAEKMRKKQTAQAKIMASKTANRAC